MPTAPTPIDALPTPPSTSDPVNFDSRADAYVEAQAASVTQFNALGTNVFNNATDAAASATAAATSAASAINSPSTSATSITSLTVSAGPKTLTLEQTGKAFALGQPVTISRTSDAAATYMAGRIDAFNAGTGVMTVAVEVPGGSGTYADWTVALSGPPAQEAILNSFLTLAADEAAALVYFG